MIFKNGMLAFYYIYGVVYRLLSWRLQLQLVTASSSQYLSLKTLMMGRNHLLVKLLTSVPLVSIYLDFFPCNSSNSFV